MVSVQKVPVSVSAVLVLSVVLSLLSGTLVDARPEPAQLVAMADALKYLHQLDKYYSQVARPSTRSAPGSMVTAHDMEETLRRYLQLQDLGKFYVNKARPRFGKRSESTQGPSEQALWEASARLLDSYGEQR
ncbi:uncharacterized protein LOC108665158 isoform X1 [Hyalella azteca]|uniref:Uncharacterized protein LOC108665158 isoform X1 n=1 Tax=Hyalella azteca TaxID=294128 RepID=A0A8B7N0L5_HYAAZ|nr:uncharacterized protein LOC108665158 isoform X1 [Hyalella azteca]